MAVSVATIGLCVTVLVLLLRTDSQPDSQQTSVRRGLDWFAEAESGAIGQAFRDESPDKGYQQLIESLRKGWLTEADAVSLAHLVFDDGTGSQQWSQDKAYVALLLLRAYPFLLSNEDVSARTKRLCQVQITSVENGHRIVLNAWRGLLPWDFRILVNGRKIAFFQGERPGRLFGPREPTAPGLAIVWIGKTFVDTDIELIQVECRWPGSESWYVWAAEVVYVR